MVDFSGLLEKVHGVISNYPSLSVNLVWLVGGFVVSFILWATLYRSYQKKRSQFLLRQRKDQFVAIASHYLLTPINLIQNAVTLLQEQDQSLLPEKRMRLYETIQQGQHRLWIMAEQMLIVGEIDQGDIHLAIVIADLSEVISSAIASVDAFSREKKIHIHLRDGLQNISQARFDPRRMKQAFIGVLDNAIKFTPEGGEVVVSVAYEKEIFSILVEDEGIGMPSQVLAHMSDPFFRGTDAYNYDYEGMGLGLHIAYAILRQHGGNITINSKTKRGTSVLLEFPSL